MARYVFLMYDTEEWHDTADAAGLADEVALHEEFMAAVAAAGATVTGGEALERSATASTVRRPAGGAPVVTDGPFADTKEALGGFYVIDAPDLDVALRLAAACPAGHVEVRPVLDLPDDPSGDPSDDAG